MQPADIKIAVERNVKAVTLRPRVGQGTATTRVALGADLRCEVTDGPWTLAVGMSEKYGGDNGAPNPGVLGRAALGSCLAIGYAMWAARLGVPVAALTVEIQADYDVRGELGVSDEVRPGYREIRAVISVESDAPEAEVLAMLDTADQRSSWLDNIRNPVPFSRQVRVTAPEPR